MRVLDDETLPFHAGQHRAYWYGSGTAALAAALQVAIWRKASRRPEVVIPAYCCPDVAAAVLFTGAIPVLADTLPGLPWMDPRALARALGPATAAVVHVRFLGLPGNEEDLRAAIGSHGAALIDDSAHVHPGGFATRSGADSIIFSFGRGKPLSLRVGGLLLQRMNGDERDWPVPPDPAPTVDSIASRIGHFMRCCAYNLAIEPTAYWLLTRVLGIRADATRLRDLRALSGFPPSLVPLLARQAAMPQHENWRESRIRSDLRSGGPWVDVPDEIALRLPADVPVRAPLWRYPLLLESESERDRLFEMLWHAGLGPSRLYRMPLGDFSRLRNRVKGPSTPMATDLAGRLLALPLHSSMRMQDYDRIRAVLRRFANSRIRCSKRRLVAETT